MNIVVIGLGSMGKRRIRLLTQHYPQYRLCGVDGQESRREEVAGLFHIPVYETLSAAAQAMDIDAAVVSSSPLSHAGLISSCLKAGLHVFTELNVVSDGYDENIHLAKAASRILFQSSTLLYRGEIEYIRNAVKRAGRCLYTYHVGQYLPDWHPWESYKDFFVADKRTNACREILCVQLPWLVAAFGPVGAINTQRTTISGLALGYEDAYVITLLHESGHIGSLAVDIVARDPVCSLRIDSEALALTWQGRPDTLRSYDIKHRQWNDLQTYEQTSHQKGYSVNIIEDAYQEELAAFFGEISGEKKAHYSIEEDAYVLDLIDRIEGLKP